MPNEGAPVTGESRISPLNPLNPTAELDKEEMLLRFIEWWKTSRDHYQPWREEALSCYDFVAGTQWSEEDLKILSDQSRPAVTFNRIQPFVDAVCGLEIGNRQETQYLPRTLGKSGVSETLTGAVQWARQECDAEDEESEAVRDVIICGLGVTQTRMDYDTEADGMIQIDRVDPLEIYPDPASRKPNYADARFVIRVKDIPLATAEEMFPDVETNDLHARWAEDQPDDTKQPHNARLAPYYRVDQAGEIDRQRMQCRLVEVEWWDYVTAYRVLNPVTGRFVRLSEDDASKYRLRARALGLPTTMMKDREKKFYKAIVGNTVLSCKRGPDVGGMTYKIMTGKRDRNRGFWYGLVRAMIDPQMWANKFFGQALQIINTNAKGGLIAEQDAFVDIEAAREEWARSDSIIEANQGALSQGKIQPKVAPPFPPQINAMMEMAINAIPSTAGINLEMIAQQTKEQAGVLEMQRKQQGMTVLAFIFDSKRRYQKEQGRLMLWMIQTFIADGRLIRIGGPEEAQYVPLIHDPGLAEYDVIVDDSPTSPNMKERVWAMIMQMFPVLTKMNLPPQAMVEMMKYSPFPAALISSMSDMMKQPPPPHPMDQARMQVDQAKAADLQARAAKSQAETQLMPQRMQLDLEEQKAKVEKARADAINALQNGGVDGPGQHFDQMMQAVDQLQESQQAGHDQRMDVAGHQLQVQKAGHDQQMAQAAHGLAQQQAAQQAMQGQQEHGLATFEASNSAQSADKEHKLAEYQAKHPPKPAARK